MDAADVIIIGAGAAGMITAYELVKKGKKVLVLEARERLGGRIHTIADDAFDHPIEAGAEFIHGNLPLTVKLLKEGSIEHHSALGKTWIYKDNTLRQGEDLVENWDVLMSRIKKVKQDMPLAAFLRDYLPEPEYASLRHAATSFVEGYDAADTEKTSTLATKAAWSNEEQWDQDRVAGGYKNLIHYLYQKCTDAGAEFIRSTIVKEVNWTQAAVEVTDEKGVSYKGAKVVITVPLGILQAQPSSRAAITFKPAIDEKINAARKMGYGSVIKMLLRFDLAFWNELRDDKGNQMKDMGYLFSDRYVPTWWTQFPNPSTVLTGWLGGPKAAALKEASDETILEHSLITLSEIFSVDKEMLKKKITSWRIFNWGADPFAAGAYSYNTLATAECKKILMQPVEDRLFFAGEALGKDTDCATVEVALQSGKAVARQVFESYG